MKAIFVNIFGGIMKCDTIAAGVITAVKEVGLKVPLVVRLEGTNVELGKKMLTESGLNIVAAADMADGAQKVVKAAKEDAQVSVLVGNDTKLVVQGMSARRARSTPSRWSSTAPTSSPASRPARAAARSPGSSRCRCSTPSTRRCGMRGANTSVIYVPPPFAADAILEAAAAGIDLDHRDHRGHPGARHGQGQVRARPRLPATSCSSARTAPA